MTPFDRSTHATFLYESKQPFHLPSWGVSVLLLVLPLSTRSQVIADFGASFPMTLKDIGNGDRLVVCRRPFGSPVDSVYMETAIAGSDWSVTPVATKRIAAPGNWSYVSMIHAPEGLILNGTMNAAGANKASLVRMTDGGDVVWSNKYTCGTFAVALPSGDSLVAFNNAGPVLNRVVVGPDGTAIGNIAISNTQNDQWSIVTGCPTEVSSEHIVAGTISSWTGTPQAVILRIGPTGAIWMNRYYVPIPGGVGPSSVSSIVRAQDGGFTCIVNAMDSQLPGIYYYSYLMHLDDDGNVLWCRGSSLPGAAMERSSLVQLENGEYSTILSFDLSANEMNRFSSTGEQIACSACQAPCNLFYMDHSLGAPFPGGYIKSGRKIAELGDNGAPCGRSMYATAGGSAFAKVQTYPLTSTLGTAPTISTVSITLADRSAEMSATLSCATTTAQSVSLEEEYIQAFPVPSNGSVNLKIGSGPSPRRAVDFRDVQGRLVIQGFAPGEVDITSLKPGIYECLVLGSSLRTRIVKN